MKHFLLILFFTSSFFCYSQQLEISTSSNKKNGIPKFWIDIKIINTTKDTLSIPKYHTFGFREESTMDFFLEFLDPKTDTVIDIQPKGDYHYLIPRRDKIKLAPNQKYEFDYYMDNIYDLDPNREYNVCLYMRLKNKNDEIIMSNSLFLPVHKGVNKKRKN